MLTQEGVAACCDVKAQSGAASPTPDSRGHRPTRLLRTLHSEPAQALGLQRPLYRGATPMLASAGPSPSGLQAPPTQPDWPPETVGPPLLTCVAVTSAVRRQLRLRGTLARPRDPRAQERQAPGLNPEAGRADLSYFSPGMWGLRRPWGSPTPCSLGATAHQGPARLRLPVCAPRSWSLLPTPASIPSPQLLR